MELLMVLLGEGHLCPHCTPLKGQGGSAPQCTPFWRHWLKVGPGSSGRA